MAFNPKNMYRRVIRTSLGVLNLSEMSRGILTPEIIPSLMARVKNKVMIWRANLVSTLQAVLMTSALPMIPTKLPSPRMPVSA